MEIRKAATTKVEKVSSIIVYAKRGCVQCNAISRALDNAGIDYQKVDVSTDPEARDYVMSLGYLQVPVVYAGPDNHFGGFRPDRITQLTNPVAS